MTDYRQSPENGATGEYEYGARFVEDHREFGFQGEHLSRGTRSSAKFWVAALAAAVVITGTLSLAMRTPANDSITVSSTH